MSSVTSFINEIRLRARLLKRVTYRTWKGIVLSRGKKLIGNLVVESSSTLSSSVPAIVISSFNSLEDFMVLSYLFREKELTFIAPRNLPADGMIDLLCSINRVYYLDDKQLGYRFFKRVLGILRDFNRSVIISPEAAATYANQIPVNPAVIVRLAMAANVPIIPVVLTSQKDQKQPGGKSKRNVWIGKKIYVSPKAEEFRDIFFKQRGRRKFSELPKEDFIEMGQRVFNKLRQTKDFNGSNLP